MTASDVEYHGWLLVRAKGVWMGHHEYIPVRHMMWVASCKKGCLASSESLAFVIHVVHNGLAAGNFIRVVQPRPKLVHQRRKYLADAPNAESWWLCEITKALIQALVQSICCIEVSIGLAHLQHCNGANCCPCLAVPEHAAILALKATKQKG